MLHAKKAHAGCEASVIGIGGEKRREALLCLVEVVRVERGEGGAFGGRARDAVVALRLRGFTFAESAGDFGVLGMGLEVLAQLGSRGGVGRIPDERLAIGGLCVRVARVRAENANAFSARVLVAGEHDAQLHGITRIAGVAFSQAAHTGDRFLLAAGRAVESLIVGQRYVAVGRMVGVEAAVDAHGVVVAALTGEVAGLSQFVAWPVGRHGFDSGDVGIVGMGAAQTQEGHSGLLLVAGEFVVAGEAGKSFRIVGRGEKNLLPDLEGEVGAAAGFKIAGLDRQAGARGVGGDGWGDGCGGFLSVCWRNRPQETDCNKQKCFPSSPAHPHRRFHSTFSSPPGPNRNLRSRKPVANRVRF